MGSGIAAARAPELLPWLADELPPDKYRIAMILHPNIWAWHGRRQVLAWYAGCLQREAIVVPPEEGWRAVLAAADVVVGDHGSVTTYAAAAGVPVLLASFPREEVEPGSPSDVAGRIAPHLCPGSRSIPQLDKAVAAWRAGDHAAVAAGVTGVPGESAR